jgi:hypothetical protein
MIKSLRTKPLRVIAIAVLPLALLGTACGSDDDSDTPSNTEASGDAPADTAGDEESGANDDVEAFCDDVDEFVEAFNKVLSDPSSGDIGALTTQAEELASSAIELQGSVDGDDSERLQECTESLSDISGG